ncbi:hypothetical protein IEQ34_018018 [Dendrobium chrysotoxum]|uniref:Pollen Ole e 1 allergen and extensin family protein n=1 Tax=Dendrobium chrysotoxum TaxID=161865 RepID=A0AAV7GDE5_DENCH|nr:hypothetical protein IEQ34_018018 [Dendrobium chrysotoxum]
MASSKISVAFSVVSAFLVICFFPASVFGGRAAPAVRFTVQGRVKVECREKTGVKTCSYDGVTDSSGNFNIVVADEHEHEICEAMLVSSPDVGCKTEVPGREKSRIFLSHNNGISSDIRFANSLGYQKDTPLAFCSELMKIYNQDD